MSRFLPLLLLAAGCKFVAVGLDDPGSTDGPGVGDDDDTAPDPPSDIRCSTPYDTPDPGIVGEGACVTDVIGCGETIQATNVGGSDVFSNEYDMAFEWCSGHGEGDELSGPERVYRFEPPSGVDAIRVRLASCEPSQLLWYQTAQVCPQERVLCQYATGGGSTNQFEDILLSGSGVVWFVVEGLSNDGGNFALTVDCPE